MLSDINLSFKVLLGVVLYQLRLVHELDCDYVFGLSFTCKVNMTIFTSTKGLADFEVINRPFFWIEVHPIA